MTTALRAYLAGECKIELRMIEGIPALGYVTAEMIGTELQIVGTPEAVPKIRELADALLKLADRIDPRKGA